MSPTREEKRSSPEGGERRHGRLSVQAAALGAIVGLAAVTLIRTMLLKRRPRIESGAAGDGPEAVGLAAAAPTAAAEPQAQALSLAARAPVPGQAEAAPQPSAASAAEADSATAEAELEEGPAALAADVAPAADAVPTSAAPQVCGDFGMPGSSGLSLNHHNKPRRILLPSPLAGAGSRAGAGGGRASPSGHPCPHSSLRAASVLPEEAVAQFVGVSQRSACRNQAGLPIC